MIHRQGFAAEMRIQNITMVITAATGIATIVLTILATTGTINQAGIIMEVAEDEAINPTMADVDAEENPTLVETQDNIVLINQPGVQYI